MTTNKHTSLTRRTITRVRSLWSEMDLAQRRSLELQTGVSITKPRRASH